MSTHGAYIVRIKVREHPNADKLALGTVGGYQVVVGKDVPDDSLGIFFSSELKLSPAYADANKLRKADGGYFSDNLRVTAQKFRGEKSDGYFASLSSLEFTGGDISKLGVGTILDEFNGVKLCEKYISPATARAAANRANGSRKALKNFPKHYDTDQFAYYYEKVPKYSTVWTTLKLHGTSGRTGYIIPDDNDKVKAPWYKKIFKRTKANDYKLVSGTRNVVLGQYDGEASKGFRRLAEDRFKDKLFKNEIAYYEIVGYEAEGVPIMGRHNFSKNNDKEIAKWGDGVTYSYGQLDGTFEVYLYRMAVMTEDTYGMPVMVDLPWPQVKRRAEDMGIKTPPELIYPYVVHDHDTLLNTTEVHIDGPDPIDNSHPREGVVVHILTPEGKTYALKHKGLTFKIGEGIAKENDNYVDAEEIA